MSHQQIAIEKFGSASTLHVSALTPRAPADDEVSIDVAYSGVNFADIQMRLGFYPDAPKRPFVPGYEVSGVVEAVGKDVTGLAVGDQVLAGTYFGGYASRVTIPAIQVVPLPKNVDLAAGAALPVNFFTAHLALFEMARVRGGDRVLIEGATGGVGTLAVQMARRVGAEVVGLTSSPGKKQYIADLGATAYTRDEFYADETIGNFDFILNASGGSEIRRQLPRLGYTGRMVCMGLNSGVKDGKRNIPRIALAALRTPRLRILKMFEKNIGVYALNALPILRDETWIRRLTDRVAQAGDMNIVPHVGKIFPATDAPAAHAYLETRQALGKVLLEW